MPRNGNPIKQWFITFSKSNIDKKDFALIFPPTTYLKSAQESHKDGSPHIHVTLCLVDSMSKPKLMAYVSKNVPSYDFNRIKFEPTRSLRHTVNYIDKEDPEPYISGTLPRRKLRTKPAIRRYFSEHPQEYYDLLKHLL